MGVNNNKGLKVAQDCSRGADWLQPRLPDSQTSRHCFLINSSKGLFAFKLQLRRVETQPQTELSRQLQSVCLSVCLHHANVSTSNTVKQPHCVASCLAPTESQQVWSSWPVVVPWSYRGPYRGRTVVRNTSCLRVSGRRPAAVETKQWSSGHSTA